MKIKKTDTIVSVFLIIYNDKMLSFIHDIEQVKQFESICITTLHSTCKSFLCPAQILNLSVRSKYIKNRNNELSCKSQNSFFIRRLYTLKSNLIDTISQLEVKEGVYKNHTRSKDGNPITEIPMDKDTLSIYFCLNPRDQIKALNDIHTNVISTVLQLINNVDSNINNNLPDKFDSAFYSALHKSQQDKQFIDVDIDTKDVSIFGKIFVLCPDAKIGIAFSIETRGGYHVIYYKNKFPRDFYLKVVKSSIFEYKQENHLGIEQSKTYVDVNTDVTIPIPGTIQGGFPVKFIDILQVVNSFNL